MTTEAIDALGKVAAVIAAGGSRDVVLELITGFTRRLVDCDFAGITVRHPDGGLVIIAAEGPEADLYVGQRYASEGTHTGAVIETGRAVILENMSEGMPRRRGLRGHALGPTIGLPIMVDGPYGALVASRFLGRAPFTPAEVEVVHTFAAHASVVLEQDAHRQRASRLKRIAEQQRLAEDLQTLAVAEIFNASVRLSGVVSEIGEPHVRERIVHAIEELDHANKLIRQIAFGLVDRTRST